MAVTPNPKLIANQKKNFVTLTMTYLFIFTFVHHFIFKEDTRENRIVEDKCVRIVSG